jgi:hypothetical protein
MIRSILSGLTLVGVLAALTACSGAAKADPVPKAPLGGTYVVAANTTDVFTVTCRGGELTRVRLGGDGDTCLELRMYDEFGNLVAADTLGFGDVREVRVVPKFTGPFKVKVTNIGSVSNKYTLVID